MKLKMVTKLKPEALSEYLDDLTVALKKEEKRGREGVFDGQSFESVLMPVPLTGDSTESKIKRLSSLIEAMDELDGDDYFGTEGWRHYLMGED